MTERGETLRTVMSQTGTTQSELSQISRVHQPSISQYLSGRIDMSDQMLSRLLSCMGYRLEIVRHPVRVELDPSSARSWRLHRQLSTHLSAERLDQWRPTMLSNLLELRRTTQGQPHLRNLDRWATLVRDQDLSGLRLVMTGLERDSIEMREVSPMGGLLPQNERSVVMSARRR